MVVKMSIACILVLLYAGMFYRKSKKLELRSTKLFSWLYLTAIINLLADLITIYTVNHLDIVDECFNYVWHVIFLLSLDTFLFLFYRYVFSFVEPVSRTSTRTQVIHFIPYAVSVVLIILLPIEYVVTDAGNYSRGPKAYALYASTLFYIVLTIYYHIRYGKMISRERRKAILSAFVIVASVSLVQMVFPIVLITGLAITLIVLGLMMSNENQEKYIDKHTGLFNEYGLSTTLNENIFHHSSFTVGVITADDTDYKSDAAKRYSRMSFISKALWQGYKKHGYRVSDKSLSFLASDEKEYNEIIRYISEEYNKHFKKENNFEKKFLYNSVSFPSDAANTQEIMYKINLLGMDKVNKMAYMDYLTGVKNRNAFEMEFKKQRTDALNLWYIIADANNLKIINDTLGHSEGDELLCAIAGILSEAVSGNGSVYRIGGDEFAVLWSSESGDINELLSDIKMKADEKNMYRDIKIDFAIGYADISQYDSFFEAIRSADRMMFDQKFKMKSSQ